MPYNLLIQQQYDDALAELDKLLDPVERIALWFDFVKAFAQRAQTFHDHQYGEFEELCNTYVVTPDLQVRASLRKEICAVAKEINHFSEVMRKVSRTQKQLEVGILKWADEEN